jgi:hypothetical protein
MRVLLTVVALVCICSLAEPAEAQVLVWSGAPSGPSGSFTYSSAYVVPYSYYAAWPNWPARGYVGYGESDIFPFYGRPYGRVYDKWTWNYMSDAYYGGVLARYYYPPVR